MFRAKAVLLACFFILTGYFFFDVQSHAQSREATKVPQKRFEISFGGGWGLYSMKNINKHYIDEFARDVGIFDDHIDNGPNLFGQVGYFVSPNVSANLGVTCLNSDISNKGEYVRTDEQGNVLDTFPVQYSLRATLVAPQLRIKYNLPFEKIDLFLSGGIAWCFGKCVLKAKLDLPQGALLEEYRFTAQGVGFLASTGASYNLNKIVSFDAELGYRFFATRSLKDKNGKIWVVDATGIPHKMNLNFSGPFILGGLRVRL